MWMGCEWRGRGEVRRDVQRPDHGGLWALGTEEPWTGSSSKGKLRFAVWEATWLPQVSALEPMRVVTEAAVLMRCFLFFSPECQKSVRIAQNLLNWGRACSSLLLTQTPLD